MKGAVKYKGTLTKAQVRKYLKDHNCPFCGSHDTSGEDLDESGSLEQTYICQDCYMAWVEHYVVDSVERASVTCDICHKTVSDGEEVMMERDGVTHAACLRAKPAAADPLSVTAIADEIRDFINTNGESHWAQVNIVAALTALAEENKS